MCVLRQATYDQLQLQLKLHLELHLCVSCAANHRLVLSVLAPIVWETART